MKRTRGLIALLAVVCLIAGLLAGCGSKKFDFPKKPINMIIPFGAGGATDSVGRAVADAAPKHLGQPMVIVNRAGASGTVAMEEALKSTDGYTMALTSAAILTVQPQIKTLKYSASDFKIISTVVYNPLFLFVSGDSPYNTVQELADDLKKNNKVLKIGHPGVGSTNDMCASAFFNALGANITKIPFKSNSETIAAILGNHVDAGAFHPIEAKEFVAAGKLKILGVFTPERINMYPEVPTIAEGLAKAGYDFKYKTMDFSSWYYLVVPKKTPDDVTNYLVEKMSATINEKEFQEKAKMMNMVIKPMKPEEAEKSLKTIETGYTSLLAELGVKK